MTPERRPSAGPPASPERRGGGVSACPTADCTGKCAEPMVRNDFKFDFGALGGLLFVEGEAANTNRR